jgi:hypothetical protein
MWKRKGSKRRSTLTSALCMQAPVPPVLEGSALLQSTQTIIYVAPSQSPLARASRFGEICRRNIGIRCISFALGHVQQTCVFAVEPLEPLEPFWVPYIPHRELYSRNGGSIFSSSQGIDAIQSTWRKSKVVASCTYELSSDRDSCCSTALAPIDNDARR